MAVLIFKPTVIHKQDNISPTPQKQTTLLTKPANLTMNQALFYNQQVNHSSI